MGSISSKVLSACLLVFLVYLLFFYRLGAVGLVGPDEPRYAQVAREMVASGDYVTPRLGGVPWFEKPVLYYWFTALAYKIHGVDETAARFASAAAAALGVGLGYWLGRIWLGHRGGLLSGLIMLTSVLYFSLARAASMDMLLTVSLTGAWLSLYLIFFPARKVGSLPESAKCFSSGPWLYLFYGSLGFSVLAKGPVGIVLVGGSLITFLLLSRQPGRLRKFISVPGFLIFLGICLPWYLLCYNANGAVFLREFFVQHNIERFTSDRYKHSQPAWFYLGVLFAGFFPWVFQLVPVTIRIFKSKLAESSKDRDRLLFFGLWVAIPLLFYTFSQSKLPGYILPVAPAIALLIAWEFEARLSGSLNRVENRRFFVFLWVQAASVILLGVLLPFIASKLHFDMGQLVPELSALPIGTGILGMILIHKRRVRALVGLYVAGVVIGVVLIATQLLPHLDRSESCRQLAAFLSQQGYQGGPIFVLGLSRKIEYGLLFYMDTPTRLIYSDDDLKTRQDEMVLVVASAQVDLRRTLHGWELTRQSYFDGKRIACLRFSPVQ